ncbi:bifunctional phosphoribosyl-AMP cyclohydrolase/phosphoribosyl-ATP diphosphatase HisIE [Aquibacillus koreensis]|uniref:Histidine biosynthesis bifunctional protein HisIE n=1 Tax=Aquibacillus koreensis TaxID=279446 RepID=A0A9X4AIS6_9BACI|nr:bifunctional phosphoribosyl-AMP cyclohydrolase/phosphoribosyl-ATP diphosphatase HisIE [Aquibacillus koreensis]MCT2536363.1 bifunctional phosphoribosyl-AMP cyclohydrolase/phosphoribosyl-ATP diphosphatase HisIE [Aquibacillus koreensis]MDC3421286.1 bifunctional phosphoribosyl-AMP cyclohydrolase/phosphoribosyl-ATP diphosphatase HisIE [Aquibacillus koreensis]
MKPDFSKGLVPAIVVDQSTNQVLMLAYMNEEAYSKTLETKQTWFFSRSRNELWNKGATSGNIQKVTSMHLDCDHDTLLVHVIPAGPACHTGETSCFFQEIDVNPDENLDVNPSILDEVMAEVEKRKQVKVENSYTNYLFDKGVDKIGKKVIEEAGEVVIAAKNEDKEEIVNEISDLIYHSFVLMADQGVSLQDVKRELTKRFSKKGNSKGDRPEIKEW